MAIEILKLRVKERARATIDRALDEMNRLGHDQLLPDHVFLATLKSPLARKLAGDTLTTRIATEVELWIETPAKKTSSKIHEETEMLIAQAQRLADQRPSQTGLRLPGERELLEAALGMDTLVPGLMFIDREAVEKVKQSLTPKSNVAA